MKKIVLGLVVIVMVILGLQIDDKLNAPTINLLNKAKPNNNNSDAYFYLMGINSAETDDPLVVGKTIYQSIQKGEEAYFTKSKEFTFEPYPEDQELPVPTGELFCLSWEDDCLPSLFRSTENIKTVLDSNSVLLKRYQKFTTYSDYATLSAPTYIEPLPPYQYLTKASRLVVLNAILEYQSGNNEAALHILSENIENLRIQLSAQDSLIGKLVFLMQLSENIDIAYLISKNANKEHALFISPLTNTENDFEAAIAREASMSYALMNNLNGNPEFIAEGGNLPAWIVKLVYKPNISINSILPRYQQAIDYARLSHKEFSTKIISGEKPEIETSRIRNFVGTILANIDGADYLNYVARVKDLDVKILLFNTLRAESNVEAALGSLNNPYYEMPTPAFLTDDQRKICFDGPLPDHRNLRCLWVALSPEDQTER